MAQIFNSSLKLSLMTAFIFTAEVGMAAICEFKVPLKKSVFEQEFTVVGKGATTEKALADAAVKCFARYEKDHGGRATDGDLALDAIDVCANPPGC